MTSGRPPCKRYAQALGGRLQIDVAFEDEDTKAPVK
jgi:hypothetical protein